MSEKARKAILARVRRISSQRHFPYDADAVEASLDPRHRSKSVAELVSLFQERQRELGGQTHLAQTEDVLFEKLVARLREVHDGPIWVEEGLAAGRRSVLERLMRAGIEDVHEAAEPEDPASWKERLADASVGVTGADWLLAETGSVVLVHRLGRPRALSLLPKHHFVVATIEQLLPNLDEVVPLLEEVHRDARFPAVTIVTGSSRTADIEKVLIRGVHGPQNLEVFLLIGQ